MRDAIDFYMEYKVKFPDNHQQEISDIDLISNLSYNLKEPLTSIKGYLQLIQEKYGATLNEDLKMIITKLLNQCLSLENRITDNLDKTTKDTLNWPLLLIDDDVETINLLVDYFETRGFSCKGVTNASKGLEELKRYKPKFVLLDILLPDIDGFTLCKMIKSDEALKDIPIYFLSAIHSSDIENKLLETGANGYITKPFNLSDFDFLIDNM
jgi:CheY-like chemotaxis protein